MQTLKNLKKSCHKNVITSLGLILLLTSCASNTSCSVKLKPIYALPPAGLIAPCFKPTIKATTPAVTASEDIPKLKMALHDCALQIEDYLKWRDNVEQKREKK